jgi:hypothetical protein
VVDELVEQFDRCLADTYSRAGRYLDELKLAASRATNEMRLLQELGRIVLDPTITDAEVRAFIYRHVSADELRAVLEECERLIRPADDSYFDRRSAARRRRGAPSSQPRSLAQAPCRRAARICASQLAPLCHRQRRPARSPLLELCALWELRLSLRAGDVWLEQSRRY